MTDDFASWRLALEGGAPGIHDGEPWCGYFRMRDRRGLNENLPAIKRPWIACAIWRDASGNLVAERAMSPVPVDWVWPWCAKNPITHETYQFWHTNERWPEEADAA